MQDLGTVFFRTRQYVVLVALQRINRLHRLKRNYGLLQKYNFVEKHTAKNGKKRDIYRIGEDLRSEIYI